MQEKRVMCTALDKLLFERVHKVAYQRAMEDKRFKQAEEEASTILKLFSRVLVTDEQKRLLDDLEVKWNIAKGLLLEFSYQQGVIDSPRIHQELKEFGIAINDLNQSKS